MIRLLVLAAVVLCPIVVPLVAQEVVTLTVPETLSAYRIERVSLVSDDPGVAADTGHIDIVLEGVARRDRVVCTYTAATTPTGTFLLTALNKANLSSAYNNNATTGSLKQRIFHRLVVMGESAAVCSKAITGTLSGSPE